MDVKARRFLNALKALGGAIGLPVNQEEPSKFQGRGYHKYPPDNPIMCHFSNLNEMIQLELLDKEVWLPKIQVLLKRYS